MKIQQTALVGDGKLMVFVDNVFTLRSP